MIVLLAVTEGAEAGDMPSLYLLWGEKMKKKILIGILSIVLIAVTGSVIYVSNGSGVRERAVIEYLENKGYSQSQIQSVQAKYSFLNIILGYQAWGVEVVFADEQNVIYGYRYDSETGVSQGSVSGGDKNTQKENLKHVEK